MRKKINEIKNLTNYFHCGGNEFPLQFWHPLQWLTMPTNVPTDRKIVNLENAKIWPVKFLMFNFKRVYPFCSSSNFNDLGIKI